MDVPAVAVEWALGGATTNGPPEVPCLTLPVLDKRPTGSAQPAALRLGRSTPQLMLAFGDPLLCPHSALSLWAEQDAGCSASTRSASTTCDTVVHVRNDGEQWAALYLAPDLPGAVEHLDGAAADPVPRRLMPGATATLGLHDAVCVTGSLCPLRLVVLPPAGRAVQWVPLPLLRRWLLADVATAPRDSGPDGVSAASLPALPSATAPTDTTTTAPVPSTASDAATAAPGGASLHRALNFSQSSDATRPSRHGTQRSTQGGSADAMASPTTPSRGASFGKRNRSGTPAIRVKAATPGSGPEGDELELLPAGPMGRALCDRAASPKAAEEVPAGTLGDVMGLLDDFEDDAGPAPGPCPQRVVSNAGPSGAVQTAAAVESQLVFFDHDK